MFLIEKIKNLLDFAGLSEKKNDKVGTYSKGMKRKLGLARAIIHDSGNSQIIIYHFPQPDLHINFSSNDN
jgi:ABC-type multidrug transport system ATPase subunit